MAPPPSLFSLMRKNWKKSAFFLTIGNTALWYTYDYTVTSSCMRVACKKATSLGDEHLARFDGQPKHLTVILNPAAGNRKSRKLYSKWVEPLFHLAGIKVSLIETESPNQAYDLMKIMSDCDAVAIVGGDGTVHEALNGLLHRPDCLRASKNIPIGIVPAGKYNSIARYIHGNLSYRNQKEFLIATAQDIIQSTTRAFDVVKITNLGEAGSSEKEELPAYVLRDVRYGKYQDNFFKVSGSYFYQNNIKPLWLRLQRFFVSKFPKPQIESITYTKPCIGCSRCYNKHQLKDLQPVPAQEKSANRRWWSTFAPLSKTSSGLSTEDLKEKELAKRDNPLCDKWFKITESDSITDFRACMMGDTKIRLSLSTNGEYTSSEVYETQDVRLKLAPVLDEEFKKSSENKQINETDPIKEVSKAVEFFIDGQPTQAHSIELSTLKKAVNIFVRA